MLGIDIVKQRLAEILRDVEAAATLKALRYVEEVKSWEVEVETGGGVRAGRIPEEWLEDDDEEKLHNRLSGLLLKERPEKS